MLVMTLLITLKHPVLGYCLCLDAYFANNCLCLPEKATHKPTPASKPAYQENCCSSTTASTEISPEKQEPCEDCVELLALDVGDFVWKNTSPSPSDTEFHHLLPPAAFADKYLSPATASEHSVAAIRGSPPPDLYSGMPPLYLRHSVLRL